MIIVIAAMGEGVMGESVMLTPEKGKSIKVFSWTLFLCELFLQGEFNLGGGMVYY